MEGLKDHLGRACDALALKVKFDVNVKLDKDHIIRAYAHISDLGGKKGILIFTNSKIVRPFWDDARLNGYGFSVLSEHSIDAPFDIETFKEMFIDWGWSGDPQLKPLWMT